MDEKWSLANVPPKNDIDVGEFAQDLVEIAIAEKERLGKPQTFLESYALYRSHQPRQQTARKGYSPQQARKQIGLFFSNIERTVSNITARNPTGEVIDMDGIGDDAEVVMTQELKKWWKNTGQKALTRFTAKNMEIYGLTCEKPSYDKSAKRPAIAVIDPFQFLPAPGNWDEDEISTKCPYICFAYLEFVSEMESFFGVKGIAPDEAYDLLGTVREEYKSQTRSASTIGNYADPMSVRKDKGASSDKKIERCLVLEIWIRDGRTKTEKVEEPLLDETGMPVIGEDGTPQVQVITTTVPVYRDGIRKITITKTNNKETKSGIMVLDDCDNPNLNPAIPDDLASTTFPWGRLPIYYANSYKDGISLWGFSISEPVGYLIQVISMIISRLIAYVLNVLTPPLIVQQHCGITREMIETNLKNEGRLILMPSTPNARIEFMTVPNLPETFFRVLDLVITLFDRVYQIEDADRGVQPTGVIAASAIVALQERNQVLMQAKTSSIDTLVENRSRWAIGLWQNHGTSDDSVDVAGESVGFVGVNYVGRKFNYVVESGSTTPRTSLQLQEDAKWLAMNKFIGQKGLLKALNWPDWKAEVEATAESVIDQALQVIIEAGFPEEAALKIREYVLSSQIQTTQAGKAQAAGGKPPGQPKPPTGGV
uniref:Portal protein n=1 Tax=viral metagenome TaxID=1070528 RepID=A0A6H1ZTZ9_9ZZZZ